MLICFLIAAVFGILSIFTFLGNAYTLVVETNYEFNYNFFNLVFYGDAYTQSIFIFEIFILFLSFFLLGFVCFIRRFKSSKYYYIFGGTYSLFLLLAILMTGCIGHYYSEIELGLDTGTIMYIVFLVIALIAMIVGMILYTLCKDKPCPCCFEDDRGDKPFERRPKPPIPHFDKDEEKSKIELIKEYKKLLDEGFISEEEYTKKCHRLMF